MIKKKKIIFSQIFGGGGKKGCAFHSARFCNAFPDLTNAKHLSKKIGERSYFDRNNNLKSGRDGMKDCT